MTKFNNNPTIANFFECRFLHDKLYNNLMEVLPVRAFVDLEGNVTYYFKNNEQVLSVMDKDAVLYKSREQYEDGAEPLPSKLYSIEQYSRYGGHAVYKNACDGDGYLKAISYTLVNDIPTEVDAPIIGFNIDVNMRATALFKEGVNVDDYYNSIDKVIWFNKYKYTNEHGEEVTQEGTRSYALLTAEQKKVVEKFRKAMDALREANITPAYSCEEGKFYFVPADKTSLEYESAREDEAFLITHVPEDQSFSHTIYEFYERPTVYKRQPKQ